MRKGRRDRAYSGPEGIGMVEAKYEEEFAEVPLKSEGPWDMYGAR